MVIRGPYNPPAQQPHRSLYNRVAMKDRPIQAGRVVHVNEFQFSPVNTQFRRMGWTAFFLQNAIVFPTLIYEFYANFEYNQEERIVNFQFQTTEYSYTLREFGELLSIPCVEDGYPEALSPDDLWQAICHRTIPFNLLIRDGVCDDYLSEQCVVPNHIIRSNIYHREPSNPMLSDTEQRLLYCLINNIPINLAHIVASRMSGLHYQPERRLPYGALLTGLFYKMFDTIGPIIPRYPLTTSPINWASVYDPESDDSTGPPPNSSSSSSTSDAGSSRRRC